MGACLGKEESNESPKNNTSRTKRSRKDRRDTVDLLVSVNKISSKVEKLANMINTIHIMFGVIELIPEKFSPFRFLCLIYMTAASSTLYHLLEIQISGSEKNFVQHFVDGTFGSKTEKIKITNQARKKVKARITKLCLKTFESFENDESFTEPPDWIKGNIPTQLICIQLGFNTEETINERYQSLFSYLEEVVNEKTSVVNQFGSNLERYEFPVLLKEKPPVLTSISRIDLTDTRLAPELFHQDSNSSSDDVTHFILTAFHLLMDYIDVHHNVQKIDSADQLEHFLSTLPKDETLEEEYITKCQERIIKETGRIMAKELDIERLIPHLTFPGVTEEWLDGTISDQQFEVLSNLSVGKNCNVSMKIICLMHAQLLGVAEVRHGWQRN